MGAASPGRRAARRPERAPRRRHKWQFAVDASWSPPLGAVECSTEERARGVTAGASAGGKAGVVPPSPYPYFWKYLIQKGLQKGTLQVCVPKGFESHCFYIDVQFFGTM